MNVQWLKILTKRFLKMFLIGGFSSVVLAMATHPLTDLVEWKSWGAVLVSAFLTGGLAALEKWSKGYNPQ